MFKKFLIISSLAIPMTLLAQGITKQHQDTVVHDDPHSRVCYEDQNRLSQLEVRQAQLKRDLADVET
jgi:hypothetical protein